MLWNFDGNLFITFPKHCPPNFFEIRMPAQWSFFSNNFLIVHFGEMSGSLPSLNSSISFKANASSSWVQTPFLISIILVVHWSFRFLLPISDEQGEMDIWTNKYWKWRGVKCVNWRLAFRRSPGMVRKVARVGYHHRSSVLTGWPQNKSLNFRFLIVLYFFNYKIHNKFRSNTSIIIKNFFDPTQ